MLKIRLTILAVSLVPAVVLLVGGCASEKLTYERFSMLKHGMSDKTEAELTLGTPNKKLGDQWIWERIDDGLTVRIEFNPDGTIKSKQWFDTVNNRIDVDDMEPPRSDGDASTVTRVRTIDQP